MILLRSVIYFATMVISVVVFGLTIALVGWFVPGVVSDRLATTWGRVNLWLQRTICGLGYRLEGAENLPDGPCIIMAKHQSTWETIGLRGLLKPEQSWVLKQELMRIPIFGWGLRFARSIPIDRAAGRKAVFKVVDDGKARLTEGRYVIIFPEGTRTAPGERKRYGVGGAVLAERSGVAVVPIAHNAGVFWRRRGVKKYPGTIQVKVGPPITSEGRKAAEIMRDVEEWIEAEVEKMPQATE
ncbi:MAG: 1-acyl-sn-glycerol-3-phosphate acyltransferase [Gammaproteobacteria bacterium]|nr:1-acyl-sn-glycerol-3-phosphate acyltransferase [Gammaproteobacteria bacterium]